MSLCCSASICRSISLPLQAVMHMWSCSMQSSLHEHAAGYCGFLKLSLKDLHLAPCMAKWGVLRTCRYNDMMKRMSVRTRLKITAAPFGDELEEQQAVQSADVRLTELTQEGGDVSKADDGVRTSSPPRAGAFARVMSR